MLDTLTMVELKMLVWKTGEDAVSHQDILNEAGRRYKSELIQVWELRNLMCIMADRDELTLPARLTHDTPEVRAYLFEKLRSKITPFGSSYWSGCPESSNMDFISLAQDLSKDLENNDTLQERVINALGKLSVASGAAGERIRDIASAFLDFPGIGGPLVEEMKKMITELATPPAIDEQVGHSPAYK